MRVTILFLLMVFVFGACEKTTESKSGLRYFLVGVDNTPEDWRDSAFVVATKDPQRIKETEAQLKVPVAERQIINGALVKGSGGYNKNAKHEFKWHFKEDDWHYTDMSIEIYDGRPYSDLDLNSKYWLDTMKRFAPWNAHILKEIKP